MAESYFLKTERLGLRLLEEEDAEEYFKWFDDEEVCQGNSHHRFPETRESVKEYVRNTRGNRSLLVLAMIELESKDHIGNISLQSINFMDRNAELAIICGKKEYWGKGYALEAVKKLVWHGFTALNLHRIYLGTMDHNLRMQGLAISAGFREEGRRIDAVYKGGKYHDIIEYGIINGQETEEGTR